MRPPAPASSSRGVGSAQHGAGSDMSGCRRRPSAGKGKGSAAAQRGVKRNVWAGSAERPSCPQLPQQRPTRQHLEDGGKRVHCRCHVPQVRVRGARLDLRCGQAGGGCGCAAGGSRSVAPSADAAQGTCAKRATSLGPTAAPAGRAAAPRRGPAARARRASPPPAPPPTAPPRSTARPGCWRGSGPSARAAAGACCRPHALPPLPKPAPTRPCPCRRSAPSPPAAPPRLLRVRADVGLQHLHRPRGLPHAVEQPRQRLGHLRVLGARGPHLRCSRGDDGSRVVSGAAGGSSSAPALRSPVQGSPPPVQAAAGGTRHGGMEAPQRRACSRPSMARRCSCMSAYSMARSKRASKSSLSRFSTCSSGQGQGAGGRDKQGAHGGGCTVAVKADRCSSLPHGSKPASTLPTLPQHWPTPPLPPPPPPPG